MVQQAEKKLIIRDIDEAMKLFGKHDSNVKLIEEAYPVNIITRENELVITGSLEDVNTVEEILKQVLSMIRAGDTVSQQEVAYVVRMYKEGDPVDMASLADKGIVTTARGLVVKPKTKGQKRYVEDMRKHSLVFGIGPAGTGKTYLAIAMAVAAVRNREVRRIILTRPAVEAGEKLGFLPGNLQDKVDPYLRPLYDALYDILGVDYFTKYMEKGIIEVAPLAYMRGRTLDDSFIILDEAQNTTREQMKMFLTRMGFGSRAVVTGDITQIDLPHRRRSGLEQARKILAGVKDIGIVYLSAADVVRHSLVQRIIKAYEKAQKQKED